MRASQSILNTQRTDPGDAVVSSHRLLLRAGLIYKVGSGLYHLLPLGLRSLRKIEAVVRQEMDASGALEIQASILTPAELWQRSGRWDAMGKELFRLQDRHETWNLLGPTHEEPLTAALSSLVHSYKDLPKNIYQIHTKFRDEIRPRFGLIRCREFIMKDAYSFHLDEGSLEEGYQTMRQTYRRIFARVGLKTISVEADTGAMGGSDSEEFMVPSEIGEEVLLISENESYRSNQEKTPVIYRSKAANKRKATEAQDELQKSSTPKAKSIAQVAQALQVKTDTVLKAIAYTNPVNSQIVLVFLRGDREVNEAKLKKHLSLSALVPSSAQELLSHALVPGFIGPLGLKSKSKLQVLWDDSAKTRESWVIGANEKDFHYQGYVFDIQTPTADLAMARAGDPSPNTDGKLYEKKGIEVGHIFKLGRKYTQAFGMSVLDAQGKGVTPWMGCYGIGINRTMAAVIEQCHDEQGICWPISVAPYEVLLISITKTAKELSTAEKFYSGLKEAGCDILWDDRDLRPGVKFNDADLIGFPIRITIGKNYFSSGILEIHLRSSKENIELKGDIPRLCQEIAAVKEKLYAELRGSVQMKKTKHAKKNAETPLSEAISK